MRPFACLLLLLITYTHCYAKPYTPKQLDDDWDVATPESVGIQIKRLKHMSQIIRRKHLKVDSVLVVRQRKLIYEKYFNQGKQKKLHDLASARKSLVSILIGLAIDRHIIKSAEQSIYELFPYKQYKHWDKNKQAIKIKHLLTMTAGWECGGWGLSPKNKCGPIMFRQKEPFKWILDLPMESEPGTLFNYNDGVPAVLRAAIMLSTQQLYLDFYYNELLKPLKIKRPKNISTLTSRDMAKIGQLYLNLGLWKGKRVISEAWIKESTTIQYPFKAGEGFGLAKGYGYYWWINDYNINGQVYESYSAMGNGGQSIMVFPSLDLVVVMTGQYYGEKAPGQELLSRYILPAISNLNIHP